MKIPLHHQQFECQTSYYRDSRAGEESYARSSPRVANCGSSPPPLRGHADLRRPRLPYIRKSMRKGTSSRRLVLKKTRRSWHATTASMKTPLSGGSMDLHLRLMGVLPFIEMSTVLASVIPPMIH